MTQEQIDALKAQGFTDSQLNAITTALGGPGNVGEQTPTYPTQQMGTGVTPGAYPTNELPGNSVLNNALDVMFPGINSARMWNPSVTYQEKAVSNARKPLFLQQEATYQEAQKRLGDNKLALNALEAKEQQGIPLTAEEMSQKENLTNQITADEQVSRNPSEEEIAEADKAAAKKVENAAKVGRGFGIAGSVMNSTFGAADAMLTSELKLGADSQMIDSGVDMTSNALMKSGNPYAMASAGILKGVNFATKAFGRSVNGFNVNIDSNSYGSNLGHFEGRSGRVWENGKMERLNDQRNAQAEMALKAKNLVEDSKFEQRARQASLNDVMLANQMALAGGVDTSILAAKHGTRLKTMSDYVLARRKKLAEQKQHSLDNVQTGTEPNVIPEGALHKNKNHIDLEDITKKGIPVISTEGTPTTFEEIKQKGGEIVQHAEIEENELILNLSLTKKLEYCRDKYDETKDDKYLIYAGKLLCKELMSNTEDNTGLINDLEDKQ